MKRVPMFLVLFGLLAGPLAARDPIPAPTGWVWWQGFLAETAHCTATTVFDFGSP